MQKACSIPDPAGGIAPGIPRVLEAALALVGLVASSPVIALVSLALGLEMRASPLFRQTRIGRHGTAFTLYKLRTMRPGTREAATHLVGADALTRVGRLARRLKVDELPQLWNVVRGDMSLVGPRPCLPGQVELVAARQAAGAFLVRPGITGLAQVQGIDMSDPARLAAIDGLYVRTRSVAGDLRLLVATLLGSGLGRDFVAASSPRAIGTDGELAAGESGAAQDRGGAAPLPPLIFLVNIDWFFCSHFLHLAQRARDAGWPVVVATHFEREHERLVREGFELVPLPARRAGLLPSGLAGTVVAVTRLLRRRPDAVVHGIGLFGIVAGTLAARLAGSQRLVFTVTGRGHTAIDDSARVRLVGRASARFCRHLADRRTTRWLAENTDDVAALGLGDAMTQGRVSLVGGAGVDPSQFPLTLMPPRGPLQVVVVARAIWSKGIDVAVAAMSHLRRGDEDAAPLDIELTIAGEPDPANPRSLTRAELAHWAAQPGIRWLGRVGDIPALLSRHHVALLASRGGEGVPRSLIEAAAAGRPIITTDVPGCRELGFETGGWVVQPASPAALARALREAAAMPPSDLEALGRRARTIVEASYTEEGVWNSAERRYRELAAQGET